MSNNKNKGNQTVLKFKKLNEDAVIPAYETPGAAGLDIRAISDTNLGPGTWAAVGTGLSVEIPQGWELQVRPRSGLAAKYGVTVLNSPGTIDSDYRGEIKVLLQNLGPNPFTAAKGDRIAQLVLARAPQAEIEEVGALTVTDRGAGGFGSTGVQ